MTGHSLDFFVLFHQGKRTGQQMDERNEASIFSRILKAKTLTELIEIIHQPYLQCGAMDACIATLRGSSG